MERMKKAVRYFAEAIGLYLHTSLDTDDIAAWGSAGSTAVRDTGKKYGAPSEDTPEGIRGNAYRHCLWTCLMCKEMGPKKAKEATDYHEDFWTELWKRDGSYTPRDAQESKIDRLNNQEGLKCCKAKSCYECCYEGDWWGWGGEPGRSKIVRRKGPRPAQTESGKAKGPPAITTPDPGKGGGRPGDTPGGDPGPKKPPKDRGKPPGQPGGQPEKPKKPPDKEQPEQPEQPEDETDEDEAAAVTTAPSTVQSVDSLLLFYQKLSDAFPVIAMGTSKSATPKSFPRMEPVEGGPLRWPPQEPNYDPCDPPTMWCPRPSGGGGGAWKQFCEEIGVKCD